MKPRREPEPRRGPRPQCMGADICRARAEGGGGGRRGAAAPSRPEPRLIRAWDGLRTRVTCQGTAQLRSLARPRRRIRPIRSCAQRERMRQRGGAATDAGDAEGRPSRSMGPRCSAAAAQARPALCPAASAPQACRRRWEASGDRARSPGRRGACPEGGGRETAAWGRGLCNVRQMRGRRTWSGTRSRIRRTTSPPSRESNRPAPARPSSCQAPTAGARFRADFQSLQACSACLKI